VSRASAAGVTWTCRTSNAAWAARFGHTSVIDAVSGAIYVIGGTDQMTFYKEVWVSTDGGALPDSVGKGAGGGGGGGGRVRLWVRGGYLGPDEGHTQRE
jgi:hypothetical protein